MPHMFCYDPGFEWSFDYVNLFVECMNKDVNRVQLYHKVNDSQCALDLKIDTWQINDDIWIYYKQTASAYPDALLKLQICPSDFGKRKL